MIELLTMVAPLVLSIIVAYPLWLLILDYLSGYKIRYTSTFITVVGFEVTSHLLIQGFFGITGLWVVLANIPVIALLLSIRNYIDPSVPKYGIKFEPLFKTTWWKIIIKGIIRPKKTWDSQKTAREINKEWKILNEYMHEHYNNAFPDCDKVITKARKLTKKHSRKYTAYNIALFLPTMPYDQTSTRYDKFDSGSIKLTAAVLKNNTNIYNELKEQFPDIQSFGLSSQVYGFNFYVTNKDLFLINMRKGKITLAGQNLFITKAEDFCELFDKEKRKEATRLLYDNGFTIDQIQASLNLNIKVK